MGISIIYKIVKLHQILGETRAKAVISIKRIPKTNYKNLHKKEVYREQAFQMTFSMTL